MSVSSEFFRAIFLTLGVFVVESLFLNLFPHLPILPGDIFFSRNGESFYLPILSPIIISIMIIVMGSLLLKLTF